MNEVWLVYCYFLDRNPLPLSCVAPKEAFVVLQNSGEVPLRVSHFVTCKRHL